MRSIFDEQGQLALGSVLIWRYRPDLWISAFWGAPTEAEAKQVVAAYDLATQAGHRFRAFIDFSRIEHIDPAAFAVLEEWTRASRASLEALLVWHVITVPKGVLGAVVCGFHTSIGFSFETRFFESLSVAAETMFRGKERTAIRTRVLPQLDERIGAAALLQLRAAMRANPDASIEAIARRLGVSPRTLQRQLAEHRTTFRQERILERIALAKERLLDPGAKIEVVARALGFDSRQHFARQFQRFVGMSPTEFRERHAAR